MNNAELKDYYSEDFKKLKCSYQVDTLITDLNDKAIAPQLLNYVKEVSDSLQVNKDMVYIAILGIFSLAIQSKYVIEPKRGWIEPANLYIALIAEPSERKSAVLAELIKPIQAYEDSVNESLKPRISEYKAKSKVLKAKLDSAISCSGKAKKKENVIMEEADIFTLQQELDELEPVNPIRLVTDDVTLEKMAILMSQNKDALGILSSEGGLFNNLLGRYSSSPPAIDLVLKSYSGDRVSVDRISREPIIINKPSLSIVLFVQPKIIESIMANGDFTGKGLNARFLYVKPNSRIGSRSFNTSPISEFERISYTEPLTRLLSKDIRDGNRRVVGLSESASTLADKWFNEIEQELVNCPVPAYRQWLGKLHGNTMRIALILHCIRYADKSENHSIDANTMQQAIDTARYFKAHSEQAFDMTELGKDDISKDTAYILSKIWDIVNKTGTLSLRVRDLYQVCKNKQTFRYKESLEKGLIELINMGYIKVLKFYCLAQNTLNTQNPEEWLKIRVCEESTQTQSSLSKPEAPLSKPSQQGGRPSEMIFLNPIYYKYLFSRMEVARGNMTQEVYNEMLLEDMEQEEEYI